MRLLILAAMMMIGCSVSQVSYADTSVGYVKDYPKMSESEYNRQKREMEKQKQSLLDKKAKEKVSNAPTPVDRPKSMSGGPQGESGEKKGMTAKASSNKPVGKGDLEGGNQTVIKRKSEPSTKKSHSDTQINFNTPKKSSCNDRTFGLCPH